MGFLGGFTEQWHSTRALQVTVRTNGLTSARRAQRLAMLRACHLARDSFRPYVVVIRSGSNRVTRTRQVRAATNVYQVTPGSIVGYYTHTDPATYSHITRNVGDAFVVMLTGDEFREGHGDGMEVIYCSDFFKHNATREEQMRIVGQVYDRRTGQWAPPPQ